MKLNQAGIANTILAVILAILITTGVTIAVKNVNQHKASVAPVAVSPSPSATVTADSPVATIKAAYTLYDNGRGTPSNTSWARMRDSQYVSPKLAIFFDNIDKGKSNVPVDPMLCAQNMSDQPQTFTVNSSTQTTATVITKQKLGADGIGGTSETSIELVKSGGTWKLDSLTCVPSNAQ